MRCSSSSGNLMPAARTLSSTCCGRDAPTIAELTFGCRNTQARASCERIAGLLRHALQPLHGRQRIGPHQVLHEMFDAGSAARVSSCGTSPGKYFPVSTPCASGEKTT